MKIKLSGTNEVEIKGSPVVFNVIDKPVYRRDYNQIVGDQSILQFGSKGNGDGQFSNPVAVAVNSKGEIIVCEQGNHRPGTRYLMTTTITEFRFLIQMVVLSGNLDPVEMETVN